LVSTEGNTPPLLVVLSPLTGEVVEGGIMPKLLSAIALRESSGF
jgi:hypothetical protein